MGCYDPPALPMTQLMKWWAYHQEEPGAFAGNRYPKSQTATQTQKAKPQSVDDQLAILRGLTT